MRSRRAGAKHLDSYTLLDFFLERGCCDKSGGLVIIPISLSSRLFAHACDSGYSPQSNCAVARQGIEPDSCFFIQNAELVQGLNPEMPPNLAPDLAVEVDIASASDKKLSIYQALGVPELWLDSSGKVKILNLRNEES